MKYDLGSRGIVIYFILVDGRGVLGLLHPHVHDCCCMVEFHKGNKSKSHATQFPCSSDKCSKHMAGQWPNLQVKKREGISNQVITILCIFIFLRGHISNMRSGHVRKEDVAVADIKHTLT